MREGKTMSNLKEVNPDVPKPSAPPPPTKPVTTNSDMEIMHKVCDWYADNKYLFKTDEFYGINIEADLFRLVKSCMEIK